MLFSKLTLSIFLFFSVINCFAQGYSIRGHITGADTGWAYISHRESSVVDSAKITSGDFVIRFKLQEPEFCAFGLSVNGNKDYYLGLFLEPKNIVLRVNTDSLNDIGIRVIGSRIEKQFQQFQSMTLHAKKMHLADQALAKRLEGISEQYALEHPDSYISAFALFSYEKNVKQLIRLYGMLRPNVRRSYFGRKIARKLNI